VVVEVIVWSLKRDSNISLKKHLLHRMRLGYNTNVHLAYPRLGIAEGSKKRLLESVVVLGGDGCVGNGNDVASLASEPEGKIGGPDVRAIPSVSLDALAKVIGAADIEMSAALGE